MKTYWRLVIADLGIILCVVISLYLPTSWDGISGRDFRPNATNAGVLIFILSWVLRFKYRWSAKMLVVSIIPVLLLTILCIGSFSGYTGTNLLNSFNLEWFVYLNLFIALPWLAGIALASMVLKMKRNPEKEAT